MGTQSHTIFTLAIISQLQFVYNMTWCDMITFFSTDDNNIVLLPHCHYNTAVGTKPVKVNLSALQEHVTIISTTIISNCYTDTPGTTFLITPVYIGSVIPMEYEVCMYELHETINNIYMKDIYSRINRTLNEIWRCHINMVSSVSETSHILSSVLFNDLIEKV